MGRLLLLFVALPAVELALLIELGRHIGTVATLLIIAGTGVLGASLAWQQGLDLVRQIQRETAAGRLPASPLVDGAILLVAAALLVTPGLLTDTIGFLCLVPAFRRVAKRALLRRLERAARVAHVQVYSIGPDDRWGPRVEKEVRDVGSPPSADGR